MPDLMTVDEACAYPRLTNTHKRKTLFRAFKRLGMRPGRMGRTYLFTEDQLKAVIFGGERHGK